MMRPAGTFCNLKRLQNVPAGRKQSKENRRHEGLRLDMIEQVQISAAGTVRDLQVWRLAMELAGQVYELCRSLQSSEQYGLISQMQRSAVSIPSNIAEGYGRESE